MIKIIEDLDTVLLTNQHFLFGKWIENSKNLTTNISEKLFYEFNAVN